MSVIVALLVIYFAVLLTVNRGSRVDQPAEAASTASDQLGQHCRHSVFALCLCRLTSQLFVSDVREIH